MELEVPSRNCRGALKSGGDVSAGRSVGGWAVERDEAVSAGWGSGL